MAGLSKSFYFLSVLLFFKNCLLVSSNIDEVIDTEDDDRALGPSGYMKREYSAIKPFVGMKYLFICIIIFFNIAIYFFCNFTVSKYHFAAGFMFVCFCEIICRSFFSSQLFLILDNVNVGEDL